LLSSVFIAANKTLAISDPFHSQYSIY